MRSVLNKIQLSALALGLVVGGVVACGDDEPAPQGNNQPGPVGDGDGTGGDGDQTGDGDGNAPVAQCQTGETQACTCDDGTSQGEQYCAFGSFTGACTGCPCTDGAAQACQCAEGGFGTEICSAGAFGECTCSDVDPDAACPASTTCGKIGGDLGASLMLPPACLASGGLIALPPGCTTKADCDAAGFSNIECVANPAASLSPFPGLLPEKICVQPCTLPTTPAP